MKYLPFNIKSDYYILNSLIRLKDLFSLCNNLGIKQISLCDNNLSASIECFKLAKSNNIKVSIGLEVTMQGYKIYLYSKNMQGYKNLLKINTLIEIDNLEFDDLINYSSNIICIIN